jgi:hypothetical protein
MGKFITIRLTPEAALSVAQNFRWFGWYVRLRRVSAVAIDVCAERGAWSFIALEREDYA